MAHIYKTLAGHRVPSVTTITGVMDKPFMKKWANDLGLRGIDVKTCLDGLAGAGTCAHYMIECFCKNTKPILIEYQKEQIDLAENSFIKFMYWAESVGFKPVSLEQELVSEKYLFGGRLDIIGMVNGRKTLGCNKIFLGEYMDFKRHFAAIIRRNIKDPNFAAERILKLVEKNFTCNQQRKDETVRSCSNCFFIKDYYCTNKVHCENLDLWRTASS